MQWKWECCCWDVRIINATVPASESKNGPLQKTVECKLFCSSGDKWNSREAAEDGVWLTSDDLEDLDRLDDDAKPLTSLLSGKNAKKVVHAAIVHITQTEEVA